MIIMMPIIAACLHFFAALLLCSTSEISSCNNLVPETVFLSHPSDISKREGDSAVFICRVSDYNEETDFLTWAVKPNLYTNVISDSYNDATKVLTSTLTVFNVGLTEQTHQCIFQRINSDYTIDKCSSRVARLDVLHFPRQDDLSCGPNRAAWIPEHDLMTFWCKVPQGNPNVVVSWQIEELITSAHPVDNVNDLLTFQHHLKARQWLHNKTLRCVVASPAFPDAELSCSVGPMKILLEPSLSVFPTNVSFHLNTPDAREKLVCEGDGVHALDSLLWSCIPPGAVLGCDGETTREIEISLNTSAYLNDIRHITAVCSAASFETEVNANLNITLIPTDDTKISCIGVRIEVEDLSLLHNVSNSVQAVISCFLQCDKLSVNHVKFIWYIDEIMWKEDLVKRKDVTGSHESILYLSHFHTQSNTSSLKCEALIENTNMLWAKNLSLGQLYRQNGTDLQIHVDEVETWTFETTTREQTISWKMDELHNISLNAHGVKSSSMQNDVSQEYIPKSTFPSTILNKVNHQTEIPSNHELDRKTLAVVSVVGACLFILIGLLALCNVIMYKHLRSASTSKHVVNKSEFKAIDPLYEEPVPNMNRLASAITEIRQTRKEQENKISRDSSSSESPSIISSNNHSQCSLTLEYEDDNTSSNCSHCFGPLNEPGRNYDENYDERRLSVDSNLSYDRNESHYENVYDNQTVIEMHRIGKPRAERNLCSSSKNLVPDKQFRLPAFPKPKNLSSV